LEAVTIVWVADKSSEEQAEVEARMGYSSFGTRNPTASNPG
jgi:hypothetical protein